MTTTTCGCTDEYGPCEEHGQVLVQREGAALRSADQLALQYIDDVVQLDGVSKVLSAAGLDTVRRAEVDLGMTGESWFSDADLSQEVHDLVHQVENNIGPDYQTYWDDGLRIVRITGGPLMDE